MSSLESNELIEGDFLYLNYFTYVKEEIDISSDESKSVEVDDYSDSLTSDGTKQQFQDVKEDIQVDDNEMISIESDADCNDSSSNLTNTSEKLISNEESRFTLEQGFENISTNQSTMQKSLKRKKRFSSKNLIDMYCRNCKKVKKRVWGDKRIVCKKCKVSLKYQCTKCKKLYKTYKEAVSHVKITCNQTSLFQCSACNYEARNKEKIDNHVQSRHSFQECSGCSEKYENNQIVKHQLYDCKSWNNPLNNGAFSNAEELNVNKLEPTATKKLAVNKLGLLLERYCKACDESVEKVRGVNICKDCKSSLLYQCIICCIRYSNLMSAYQHIRSCIQLVQFHCFECGFQSVYKTSLANHIENKHVLQECEACDVICKNRRSLINHKKYECQRSDRVKRNKSK